MGLVGASASTAPRVAAPEAVGAVEWRIGAGLVPYPEALAAMEERVAAIRAGAAPELVWLLEHPPLYTAGTSARARDLLGARALSGVRGRVAAASTPTTGRASGSAT